jgi:hypothetical protein
MALPDPDRKFDLLGQLGWKPPDERIVAKDAKNVVLEEEYDLYFDKDAKRVLQPEGPKRTKFEVFIS